MMFVRSPGSFYTMRFLLGLAEAGFYPGVLLYLTYWVPASLRARVISRFLALTAILGLFGGVVVEGAVGIQALDVGFTDKFRAGWIDGFLGHKEEIVPFGGSWIACAQSDRRKGPERVWPR